MRRGRRALHGPLADERLRPDRAVGVGAEVLEAAGGDVEDDRRLLVLGDVQRADLADLDAGDLDVLARDHERGVVEDGAHLVPARVARAGAEDRDAGGSGQDGGDGGDPFHGPGGTWLGSQSGSRRPSSVNGADLSSGGWEAAPGQRRSWWVWRKLPRWDGGIGTSSPGLMVAEKALKIGWMRA